MATIQVVQHPDKVMCFLDLFEALPTWVKKKRAPPDNGMGLNFNQPCALYWLLTKLKSFYKPSSLSSGHQKTNRNNQRYYEQTCFEHIFIQGFPCSLIEGLSPSYIPQQRVYFLSFKNHGSLLLNVSWSNSSFKSCHRFSNPAKFDPMRKFVSISAL